MQLTMVTILMLSAILILQAKADEGTCKDGNGEEYKNGASFKHPDGCNRCFCTDGVIGCTEMACPPPRCVYKGNNLQQDETFKDDCNTCRCLENGEVVCTLMACPPSGCTYKGKNYQVKESFNDDCNTCRCLKTGVTACTRKACPKVCKANGEVYQVGETYSVDGCNTCTCTEAGVGACTLMACN